MLNEIGGALPTQPRAVNHAFRKQNVFISSLVVLAGLFLANPVLASDASVSDADQADSSAPGADVQIAQLPLPLNATFKYPLSGTPKNTPGRWDYLPTSTH